jgi:uncharacterized protein (PEP-CTERM system associated)
MPAHARKRACPAPGPLRRHAPRLTLAALLSAGALPAVAGDWTYGASATGRLTLTDNVRLAPRGQEEADLILSVAPTLTAQRRGARASLSVTYIPTLHVYLENRDSDNLQNYLSGLFSAEAVEDFFFVDASANIRQTFISPFDSLLGGESINDNLAQTTTLGLSPYVRGVLGTGYTYLVRNDNFWTTSDASALDNLYESRVLATVASPLGRLLRWDGEYDYNYTKFETQPAYVRQLLRLRGIYRSTRAWDTRSTITPSTTTRGRSTEAAWTGAPRRARFCPPLRRSASSAPATA